jgi:transposase-like protein
MSDLPPPKKPRADGQISGLAGEFFVAAELLKREIQTSVTFGNAKSIDLFARNPRTGRTFCVQVKSLRAKNFYPISPDRVDRSNIYVFVSSQQARTIGTVLVVSGDVLINDAKKFGKWYTDPKFSGLHPKHLVEFENNWALFEEAPDER